jgi:hypothetical protein
MAADTLEVFGSLKSGLCSKIFHAKDGSVAGGIGLSRDCVSFEKYMKEVCPKPKLSKDFVGLILKSDGSVRLVYGNWNYSRAILPAAIGSGDMLAVGAMMAGASPQRAIEIAIKRDSLTGGEIESLSPIGSPFE